MSCQFCADENGDCLFPYYGAAPHTCFYKIPGATIGQSQIEPRENWPKNFKEDPDCPGEGAYLYCPECFDRAFLLDEHIGIGLEGMATANWPHDDMGTPV
jgi:hypothetical protein